MSRERNKNLPAALLILMKGDKTLLTRRFNTGYADGNYSMVGGHVERGETFKQCIIREAQEEIGILLRHDDLEFIHVMHRNDGTATDNEWVDVFFIAKQWQGEPQNKEPHKCDDLSWFSLDNLPKNIIPFVVQVLDGVKNKIYYSEHGWK